MKNFYWNYFIVLYWPLVIIALLCYILASLAGLSAPLVMKFLIDDALIQGDVDYLHVIAIGIVILYFIRGVFFYLYGYVMAKAGHKMLAALRQNMFQRLQCQDYAYFISNPTGEIMSLFTNDLLLIQQSVSQGIPDLVVETLNLAAIVVIMIYFDWKLAVVTFATLPFIIVAITFFNKKIAGLNLLVQHTLATVNAILHQFLLSVMLVQSYVREEHEYRNFSMKVHEAATDFLKAQRLNAILVPLVEFLAAIGITIIVWYGGREVIDGQLTIGGMFAFLVYIINVPMPVRKMSEAVTRLKLGTVAWRRIHSLYEQRHTVLDGEIELVEAKGLVNFDHVAFRYLPDADILKDIQVIARPGDVIAIVGPSGAGKSSFANLLLRFYDPVQGMICLDGIDIRKLTIRSLRRHIGFIQQEPILFNTSIIENIKYGRPDASFAEVEKAARMAKAHDFIVDFPSGYNTLVGELGGNLSGGQRQRIAIARAMIMQPAILLLDEPTAALDAQAEKQVMEAIRQVSVGRTTFIITHRLSTLLPSDKVIYLVDGQIVETGLHEELLRCGGLYAQAVQREELMK
ncbi:MAG: putative multidrug export ATP-binding/permease protein [Firmicutes bacterium]|nr:putative multidrug export ATP-binding/permease protein [Bacillota bacterium]